MEMSKPSLRLQLTKLVLYHILLWQLGWWPQSKFHCRAAVLPLDEVSALRTFISNLELKQELFITNMLCWEGVSYYGFTIKCDCNNKQCRISEIEISNLGLTGTIHEGVGYLSNLKVLSLANNKLHGSIPDTLGNLMNLLTLDLSKNQLSGSIPASLGGLVSLQWLYLQYNLLSEGIPQSFGSLKNLQQLNLQFNMLSGSIPEAIGDLSKLTTMDLSENKLSGPLPENLKNLKSLTAFWVSANYLSEEFPKGYDQLTNLKEFSIAGNNISGPLPVNIIAKWTHINTLVLVGNNFNGSLTKEIFNLKNLQYLLISDLANDGDDGFQLPPKIANSANFISLTLRNCKITGEIPQYIGEEMTALRYLDLSFNKLTGRLPRYMKSDMIYMSFSGNMLNGKIPHWIFTLLQTRMDLSFNKFSAIDSAVPSNLQLNLFACCGGNSSTTAPDLLYTMDPFEMKNTYCPENKPKYHSLFINCGGEETTVLGNNYDQDNDTSLFYTSPKKNWAYSLSGDFGVAKINRSNYIKSMKCGVSITEAPLYEKARLSPQSLRYYAFCLRKGKYNVTLHFNEIVYTEDADYTSLRKRTFDVYIQDKRRLPDFDIKDKEGSTEKPIIANFSAVAVDDSGMLKIHLDWPGKGSFHYMPSFNGPLISAISVTPEFKISPDKYKPLLIALITIASIIAALLLLLAFAWRMGWLSRKGLTKIKIGQGKFVTVKELIDATEKFSDNTKLGISGTVYKAELQDTCVAVKKLVSAHFNENIEELKKEIGTIRSLQHENVLKLFDVYIEKDLQFLVYEYMEKKSLADNLFAAASSNTSKLKLNWETRVNICLGIAKGLKYLHEHPRAKIIHGNIKSANILLNENLEAKISDFGYATLYTEEDKVGVIAREFNDGYMAPEYLRAIELTSKADVFSFGVVVLEIVSGKKSIYINSKAEAQLLTDKAYQANKKGKLMSLVDKSLSTYDEREALIISKLALKCTRIAAPGRPTMSEVVSVLDEISPDKVSPPANLTGDVKVAGSTSGELTSVASTSQFTEGAHEHRED